MKENYLRMETARRCSGARVAASVSTLRLAAMTGIPYTSLERKLKGYGLITVNDVVAISQALGVTLAELLPPPYLIRGRLP